MVGEVTLALWLETIADPVFGLDVARGVGFGLEFSAQMPHKDPQGVELTSILLAPNRAQQFAIRHQIAGVSREVDKDLVLLGRKRNRAVPYADSMFGKVDMEIADFNRRGVLFSASGSPPEVGTDSSQQLFNAEWLGYVIVGAGIERLSLIVLIASRREHNDRNRGLGSNNTAKLNSGHIRHAEIGDHQIGKPVTEGIQAFPAVFCRPHGIPAA